VTEAGASRAAWTDADTEALFAALGRYVIVFQWIEGVLDQILLLAWGHENWGSSQAKLAKMKNKQKVDAVKKVVLKSSDFARVHTRPEWCAHFVSVIERLHAERMLRNAIMHSQYLFQLADAGLSAPLSSNRRMLEGLEGKAVFDQQELTKERQTEILRDVAQLAIEVNFLHVQLVHDYRAPIQPVSP